MKSVDAMGTGRVGESILHVIDGGELCINKKIEIADQILQESLPLLVEESLVALAALSPGRIVERGGGLMVHFRTIMYALSSIMRMQES